MTSNENDINDINIRKKLLIAESSRLISKIIEKKFIDEGYDVFLFDDELKAFDSVSDISPDCILLDENLSNTTGAQICCLLKSSSYSNIPVIIYCSSDKKCDFLLENCGADDVIYVSFGNIDEIVESVNNALSNKIEFNFYGAENQEHYKVNVPSLCAIRAMEKNRFYYYILRSLFDLAVYITDLDVFTENILSLLCKLCDFDMAVFIFNQNPFIVYTTHVEGFDKNDKYDFLKICRSDFESNLMSAKNYSFVEKELDIFPEKKDFHNKKFASYKCFPLMGDDYIGTIHLASFEKNFFKNSVCDNILYFVENSSVMLEQSLKYKQVTSSAIQMRTVFSKFVPTEIIDDLLSSDAKRKTAVNEKRKVAILICDIRNFTTISEVNEPETVVSFLNGYFKQMVEVIKRHGGTIDKFIGDAIMALFGAPISYADNAERALQAAFEMTALLPNINCDLLKIPEGLKFDIGTGIHYGEVIVGSIGCEEKSDYTVIGDSANLTSRLEGLTKIYGSKIIISQSVKDELTGSYNLLNVDTVKVKGKHKGVPIYRADLEPLPSEYISNYNKGLSLYKNGAWNLAVGYFDLALSYLKNDKSAKLMIERCNEFMKNPPENWEGAISLTFK